MSIRYVITWLILILIFCLKSCGYRCCVSIKLERINTTFMIIMTTFLPVNQDFLDRRSFEISLLYIGWSAPVCQSVWNCWEEVWICSVFQRLWLRDGSLPRCDMNDIYIISYALVRLSTNCSYSFLWRLYTLDLYCRLCSQEMRQSCIRCSHHWSGSNAFA